MLIENQFSGKTYCYTLASRKHDSPPPSFVSTTTTTSDAVPHYLLLAAGSLLFALLGLFGLWLGCFYLSGGGGGAGGFGSRVAIQ